MPKSSLEKFTLDTNIFIRMLTKDQPKMLAECRDIFEYIHTTGGSRFKLDLHVAMEVIFVLTSVYHIKPEFAVDVFDRLRRSAGIALKTIESEKVFSKAIKLNTVTKVGFSDCLIAAGIEETEAIITYNTSDFARLGVAVLTPRHALKYLHTK